MFSNNMPLDDVDFVGHGAPGKRRTGINIYGRAYAPGRPLKPEERREILACHMRGMKVNAIARELRISHGCISKIINRHQRLFEAEYRGPSSAPPPLPPPSSCTLSAPLHAVRSRSFEGTGVSPHQPSIPCFITSNPPQQPPFRASPNFQHFPTQVPHNNHANSFSFTPSNHCYPVPTTLHSAQPNMNSQTSQFNSVPHSQNYAYSSTSVMYTSL